MSLEISADSSEKPSFGLLGGPELVAAWCAAAFSVIRGDSATTTLIKTVVAFTFSAAGAYVEASCLGIKFPIADKTHKLKFDQGRCQFSSAVGLAIGIIFVSRNEI